MKIAIDAGHGMKNRGERYDPGAVVQAAGARFEEADVALAYALALRRALAERGAETFSTRSDRNDPAPVGMRARRAERAGCTHLVSLHLDASADLRARGTTTFFRSVEKDRAFAERLHRAALIATGFPDRGLRQRRDLAVLRFAPGPCALIELGFLTHPEDRAFLQSEAHRLAVCRALAEAILSDPVLSSPG